jgi:tellurite resistance protein TehA-like permease
MESGLTSFKMNLLCASDNLTNDHHLQVYYEGCIQFCTISACVVVVWHGGHLVQQAAAIGCGNSRESHEVAAEMWHIRPQD